MHKRAQADAHVKPFSPHVAESLSMEILCLDRNPLAYVPRQEPRNHALLEPFKHPLTPSPSRGFRTLADFARSHCFLHLSPTFSKSRLVKCGKENRLVKCGTFPLFIFLHPRLNCIPGDWQSRAHWRREQHGSRRWRREQHGSRRCHPSIIAMTTASRFRQAGSCTVCMTCLICVPVLVPSRS